MAASRSAWACLGLACLTLSGCLGEDVPNTGDNRVDVVVSNQGATPHWYDVSLLAGGRVALHDNATVARTDFRNGPDDNPQGEAAGYHDAGWVRPGRYEVTVRSSGGPPVSQVLDLRTEHVVYVSQDEPGLVRISISRLGE